MPPAAYQLSRCRSLRGHSTFKPPRGVQIQKVRITATSCEDLVKWQRSGQWLHWPHWPGLSGCLASLTSSSPRVTSGVLGQEPHSWDRVVWYTWNCQRGAPRTSTGYFWVVHDETPNDVCFDATGTQPLGENRVKWPFILWTHHCPYTDPHRTF